MLYGFKRLRAVRRAFRLIRHLFAMVAQWETGVNGAANGSLNWPKPRGKALGKVFVGLGEGWLAEPDSNPTADDVAAHFSEVSATQPFTVPGSIFEEVFAVCERLGVNAFGQ